jgi:hypothetical protein
MSELAQAKSSFRESERKNGVFDKGRYKSKAKFPCVNGKSAGEYSCANVDMRAFLSHEDMGSVTVSEPNLIHDNTHTIYDC